ncbi:hypothetical protein ADK41_31570 [Streptomyces caelestis]|uniref:Amidohydrolase n=1 Tax=Streptomyces caelestis TaxID=36816 RepID=A0A0M9X6B3_9ACTN|nr:hypothetical protein [Streptomyces sp. NRRL F-2305]KOT31013.1 hypothetical protein ADK41_31570 [Streptomyces caelestis]
MTAPPVAFSVPYAYWCIGGTALYKDALRKGAVAQDVPVNHSPRFPSVLQPALDTGVTSLTAAALARLAP